MSRASFRSALEQIGQLWERRKRERRASGRGEAGVIKAERGGARRAVLRATYGGWERLRESLGQQRGERRGPTAPL